MKIYGKFYRSLIFYFVAIDDDLRFDKAETYTCLAQVPSGEASPTI